MVRCLVCIICCALYSGSSTLMLFVVCCALCVVVHTSLRCVCSVSFVVRCAWRVGCRSLLAVCHVLNVVG